MNVLDRFRRLPGLGNGASAAEQDDRLGAVQRVGATGWDDRIGGCRVVRSGDVVAVAGCTATDADETPPADDAHAQTAAALENALSALGRTGLRRSDVVRSRLYVVDLARHAEAVTRAHSSVFDAVRPAVTVVGVAALTQPGALVEVELDAVRRPGAPH